MVSLQACELKHHAESFPKLCITAIQWELQLEWSSSQTA